MILFSKYLNNKTAAQFSVTEQLSVFLPFLIVHTQPVPSRNHLCRDREMRS